MNMNLHAASALALAGVLGAGAEEKVPAALQDNKDDIWKRLEFYANGRLRWESTFNNIDGTGAPIDDRHRGRMRLRFGSKYKLSDEAKVEARLSTASDGNDANNAQWDFGDGDGFNSSSIVLDRFFIDYVACEGLNLRAGKMPHQFAQAPVLFDEWVWDLDVSPSGGAAIWAPKSDGLAYDVRVGAFDVTEVPGGHDPKLVAGQGNLFIPVGDETKVQISSAYYDWIALDKGTAVAGNQGNTDVLDGDATGGFRIWDSLVAATYKGGPLGQTVGYVEYMKNLDDKTGEDSGIAAGVQLGLAGHKGDYNVFAIYYSLDANAVFSPPSQEDTFPAGTGIGNGINGVAVGGSYFLKDGVALKLWALSAGADAQDEPLRIRLDLDFNIL